MCYFISVNFYACAPRHVEDFCILRHCVSVYCSFVNQYTSNCMTVSLVHVLCFRLSLPSVLLGPMPSPKVIIAGSMIVLSFVCPSVPKQC